MENRNLEDLLATLARKPVPALPGSFADDVFRAIRQRANEQTDRFIRLHEWYEMFFHPRQLVASFVIALAVGLAVPFSFSGSSVNIAADTSESLGLHAFTISSKSLPSGLLARMR